MSVIAQLLLFTARQEVARGDNPPKSPALNTLRIALLVYPLALLGAGLSSLLGSLIIQRGANENTASVSQGIDQALTAFYLGVVFAPIVEEIVFRGWLKLKLRYIFAALGYLLYRVVIVILSNTALEAIESLPDKGFVLQAVILPFGLIGLGYLLGKFLESASATKQLNARLEEQGEQKSRMLIVLSTLLFAWIHGGNVFSFNQFWYLAPLLTLSQLIGGFVF
ncbi:MAG: hypothetical protein ACK41E_09655, partial [Deinococcales bacterium]